MDRPTGPPARTKRQKELARQAKQREKQTRLSERRSQKEKAPLGEDPDIAGIVPGPQPPRDD
jgi:hypothetical protein